MLTFATNQPNMSLNDWIKEQEQKGVTVPSNADIMFAEIPWNFVSILFDLSAGK